MTRNNKLLKAGLIVVLACAHYLLFAQSFQYSNSRFNISLPSLTTWNPGQTSPAMGYSLFIETGNGRYIKYPDPQSNNLIVGSNTNPPFPMPYSSAIPGPGIPSQAGAILNIVGHYDTIKPPKGLFAMPFISNTSADFPPQVKLAPGKRIGFNFSDSSVVIGDTMTLVITYKPDTSRNYVVVFFYNENNTLGKPFTEITNTGLTYPFADGTANRVRTVNAIRTWSGENPTLNIDQVPAMIKSTLQANPDNFNNAVYFNIPNNINLEERNIFFSLVSPQNPALLGAVAKLKARLIGYNPATNTVDVNEPVSLNLPIGLFASDPNSITTSPHCLNERSTSPYGKPVQYDIHFQNVGDGPAKKVEIEVFIPEGIQLPSPAIKNGVAVFTDFSVRCTAAGKTIKFVPENPNASLPQPNTFKIISSGQHKSILFTMSNIYLQGRSADFMKSNGDIHFTLKARSLKGRDAIGPATLPECMYSDLKITFTSIIGGVEYINHPMWASDAVRTNCIYITPMQAPCPPRPVTLATEPKTQQY